MAFWKDALKADLIKNRGYTLINESQLQDGGGHQGTILTLETRSPPGGQPRAAKSPDNDATRSGREDQSA